MGFIYKITNKINGKKYIGQTTRTIEKRWQEHLREKDNCPIHKAIRKYGETNFIITELEECPNEKLNEREIFWISYYDSYNGQKGYNATKGGQNTNQLIKWVHEHPQEIKKHLDRVRYKSIKKFEDNPKLKAEREKKRQEGYQLYIKNNYEQWLSHQRYGLERARQKLKEQYEKDPSAIIKRAQENGKKASRPVYQIDIKTKQIIQKFESCSAAARSLGKDGGHSNISRACRTKGTAYGYNWTYVD